MLKTKKNLIKRASFKLVSEALLVTRPIEHLLVRRSNNDHLDYPPVFIVCAPRSGSTVLYQILTNYFNLSYISNFSAHFYNSLCLGFAIENFLFLDKPHNTFKSDHGKTPGRAGPHECGQFWYRWFPIDRHFVSKDDYSKDDLEFLRRTIGAVMNLSAKPLLFKNCHNGQRLQIIHKILPESLIIFATRNPLYIAQSILRARIDFYGDKSKWYSTMPKNVDELDILDYPEQIVKQIYYLVTQIKKDMALFPASQTITVEYENLCKDMNGELARIKNFFKANNCSPKVRESAQMPKLKLRDQRTIDEEDFTALQKEINKLDWDNGHN